MSRLDPSQTTGAARRLEKEVIIRFRDVARALSALVGGDDAFGLESATVLHIATNAEKQVWRFRTNEQKLAAFRGWLDSEFQRRVMTTSPLARPWLEPHVRAAFGKGAGRAFRDSAGKPLRGGAPAFFAGSRDQFLRQALSSLAVRAKVEVLASMAFEDLRGVTAVMGSQLNRILANGLIRGQSPKALAKEMTAKVEGLSRQRALLIARTSLVAAHAEGQLAGFEALGAKEVGVFAEWNSASDGRVCGACAAMNGVVFKVEDAHELIPLHPNCRCCFTPGEGVSKRAQAAGAIAKAQRRQTGSKSKKAPGKKSTWAGKELLRKLQRKAKRGKK